MNKVLFTFVDKLIDKRNQLKDQNAGDVLNSNQSKFNNANAKMEQILDDLVDLFILCKRDNPEMALYIMNKFDGTYYKPAFYIADFWYELGNEKPGCVHLGMYIGDEYYYCGQREKETVTHLNRSMVSLSNKVLNPNNF